MAKLSEDQIIELQNHLQSAVIACADRGLYQSQKWAAELLNSFPVRENDRSDDVDFDSSSTFPPSKLPNPEQQRLEAREYHKYLLAKSFFDCREYDRCAAVFLPTSRPRIPVPPPTSQTTPSKTRSGGKERFTPPDTPVLQADDPLAKWSHKSLFLAIYAKYLAGEKRRDEESEMILGPADGGMTMNKELPGLIQLLGDWLNARAAKSKNSGGWLEYLYGILLAKNKSEDEAKEWFLQSVHLCPFNWGAWQELSNLIKQPDEVELIVQRLPLNIMTFMFVIYTNQEIGQFNEQLHSHLDQLERYFPTSAFLKSQRALLFYHSKDFEDSNNMFSQLLQTEPYRLDSLDTYSNVLYVLDNRPRLAFLAQLAAQTDKFRPETCCIVGNYYSRNSEHEKAVMYFRRALTLDRSFQSAWTLMGHEYVEMKNTHDALESYRRAVDVNRKDYRAWHGLGLAYEMLDMYSYALHYHQRAAALRPFDAKIWQAMGNCFARVGKIQNAIRAFKRALVAGSHYADGGNPGGFDSEGGITHLSGGILDPECLFQIALLYQQSREEEECAAYMELVLAQEEGPASQNNAGGNDLDSGVLGGLVASQGSSSSIPGGAAAQNGGTAQGGVGVTATTSKARMWLAKYAYRRAEFQRASELANELCQDGVEVEEAKALIRDIRSRVEGGVSGRLRED